MTEDYKCNYRIVWDWEQPNHMVNSFITTPSNKWMKRAMAGGFLPPINVVLELYDDEQKAIDEGTHDNFQHDREKWEKQFTGPKLGPLTEEQAIEYLCMISLPRELWAEEHNRPRFKIVTIDQIPTDRRLRNAWEMAA